MPFPDTAPHTNRNDLQAATGRPVGVGHPTFATAAARLFDNGYEPLPIIPGAKRPSLSRWTAVDITAAEIDALSAQYTDHGVGLRTGALVGLDIDILDQDLAYQIHRLAVDRLGETVMRVGLWPKQLLVYRSLTPRSKQAVHKVEALGLGQQFVAFGVHPDTGAPYYWPDGDSPLDVPLCDLPLVDSDGVDAFLAEAEALSPRPTPRSHAARQGRPGPSTGPVWNDSGQVVDGRDGWLSSIAFHAVHDVLDRGKAIDAAVLSDVVWGTFEQSTDLGRDRKDGGRGYALTDARRKVEDKLGLHRQGRLPSRAAEDVVPPVIEPTRPVTMARDALQRAVNEACREILRWRETGDGAPPPQIGIRATVGLGKSVMARRALMEVQRDLTAIDAPSRIAVFTPSHALAEEAAVAWAAEGAQVAVHQGYERTHPGTGAPMCSDLPAVRLAIQAGAPVRQTVCIDQRGNRCRFFETCAKQRNIAEVAAADVALAAYDALFTGFAAETSTFGALLIDEACWPRARRTPDIIDLEQFAAGALSGLRTRGGAIRSAAASADLADLRRRLADAFDANGEGPLARETLRDAGLTSDDCRAAAEFERRRIREPGLYPGAPQVERHAAAQVAARNAEALRHVRLWRALTGFADGDGRLSGRVSVGMAKGSRCVVVERFQSLHQNLGDTPVLHLDATMRPALARRILPRLTTETIEADAPHMTLRLVTGGFGKRALIQAPFAAPEENARRARKLAACVDHVAWEARRVAPGRTLVITYKDAEAAFQKLAGVETAHFNAIAGLDRWRDVALLIIIGRPLPSDQDAAEIAGAMFDHHAEGGYSFERMGVRMRDTSVRGVRTIVHDDPQAETIRAAICDDELIQAIGRGRGVNRTADDPLEVQLLAYVALPLMHDNVTTWELVAPDIVQRMLLVGIAVDSPQDAVALHPVLFSNVEQAKKQLKRNGFKGQIPYRNTYRGMSLKSARYRLPGRGRGWTNAFWHDGDESSARQTLTRALGALAEWIPGQAL